MGLFNNHDVKQCLREWETRIQLLVAARNHLLKQSCLFSLLFFLHMADVALSHF